MAGVFAVVGERDGVRPRGGRLFKVTVPQAVEKFTVFNYPKK